MTAERIQRRAVVHSRAKVERVRGVRARRDDPPTRRPALSRRVQKPPEQRPPDVAFVRVRIDEQVRHGAQPVARCAERIPQRPVVLLGDPREIGVCAHYVQKFRRHSVRCALGPPLGGRGQRVQRAPSQRRYAGQVVGGKRPEPHVRHARMIAERAYGSSGVSNTL